MWDAPPSLAADEIELYPDDWTPAFFASAAVAGGAPWEAGSDAAARRVFWEWWLDELMTLNRVWAGGSD